MATKFSIKDPNPAVWFKFDESDPESGEIGIRALNANERQKIGKACIKRRVEYKHGQRFEVQDTDDELYSEMLWDYCIVDWKKLEDDDGKTIPCTTEKKLFLMRNNPGFAQFVSQCLEMLAEKEDNRIKMIEKNLSSGPRGSGKSPRVTSAES